MLDTGGSVLTDAGAILLADALSREVPLQFTTIKLGDGELTETDIPAEFTGLISYWKDIEVTSVSKTDDVLRIRGVYSNDGLEASQWVREVGVFAKTDEIEECLFCYINDGDGEELPSGDSGSIVERVRDVLTTISGATAETILDSSTVYATIFDIEDAVKSSDQSITVSDDGISANHNYIFGDNYGGIIEEVTDIEEDKIYLSTNSSQYYRALNTASGSWSGADETDFKCITNFKLSEEIKSLDENKLETSDIENLLRLGYTFGGNLSEQETVVSNYIYNAYDLEEDSADHVYYLCNTGKSWTLGDDNPDSDFEEFTAKSISNKVETLFTENLEEVELFSGSQSSTGVLTLSDNWDNYKEILIIGYETAGANIRHFKFYTSYIVASDLTSGNNDYEYRLYEATGDRYISGCFRDTNRDEIYITERVTAVISKVIGIGYIG